MGLRLVKQRDEYGCGIACVAMATRRKYGEIRAHLFDDHEDAEGTQLRHLRAILKKFGVRSGKRLIPLRTRKVESLPFDALIKINPRQRGREWHWVIWDHRRGRILDPKKKPYLRRRYVSYTPLHRIGVGARAS